MINRQWELMEDVVTAFNRYQETFKNYQDDRTEDNHDAWQEADDDYELAMKVYTYYMGYDLNNHRDLDKFLYERGEHMKTPEEKIAEFRATGTIKYFKS